MRPWKAADRVDNKGVGFDFNDFLLGKLFYVLLLYVVRHPETPFGRKKQSINLVKVVVVVVH